MENIKKCNEYFKQNITIEIPNGFNLNIESKIS